MKKLKLFGLSMVAIVPHVYGINTIVVKNIRVEGLQRIEIGTVFSYLPIKVGETLDNNKADEIIERLYSTGFFQDVRVEEDGDTLIIDIAERPIIADLVVTGDHEFDHDLLMKSLKDNGLSDGKIFDQSVLDQAILGLKSEYYNRGLYAVIVTPKVVQLARNRVSISIEISEGISAKIAAIKFVGNEEFSQSKLASQMYLNTGNWLSWWYKDNQYSSDKLSGDIEKIKSFYLDQGYINFNLRSVQVQLLPDKKSVYITLNLSEGKQYRVSSTRVAGDIKDVPMAELEKVITIESGQIVNQAQINKTVTSIKTVLGGYGYAFATVNPLPDINSDNLTVGYTFFIDTGKKIYVHQINIVGNDKTRDVVVRRELRQTEDSLYDANKIQRSKDRLNLLGYFKTTDVTTVPVAGANDQVDMNVKVEENNTGSINLGVGYAQGSGILLNSTITQANLLGSGKSASLSAGTSASTQNVSLSFTDPYYRPNGTSLGYDVYYNDYNADAAGISPYQTQTIGMKARTGIPVSEFDKINFSLGVENNQITTFGDYVPQRFTDFTDQFGDSVNSIPFSVGWSRNTTDSSLWPTTGAKFSQVADLTLPGIGPQWYRFNSQNTWYIPLSTNFTWKISGQAGFINAYGDSETVPFYNNFFLGGLPSIPGYYPGTLGPQDTDGATLGGTREVLFTNDILFPFPGMKDEKSVRLNVFYDMGSLWGGDPFNISPEQAFRASYGMGLTWISPLGPLRINYAFPMFSQPNDQINQFQFMLGTSF